ncbi:septal ring lytic transglycosylase RlpA family protein [Acidocella sp.]|uniref:septal ring lytic transglycosylase RlpA family protein n=1 Tax=Acidocella sp. TaxID=50710 RepID=UPI003D09085D
MELTPKPWRAATSRFRLAPAMAMSLIAGLLSACAATPMPGPQASIAPAPVSLPAPPPPAPVQLVADGPQVSGTASWYRPGPGLHRTCTGERFTGQGMTAASSSAAIPVGTKVRVALANDDGRSIIVRVNDCMPPGHRLLDLSEAAAEELGLMNMGVARVTVTPVVLVDSR